MKKQGFTLAEVLITLAIIGVVAAISIPSVVANTQQKEFQTGLRKAVSVLNSAITMNMALDGESPYENVDLYNYLIRHMAVIRTGVTAQRDKIGTGAPNAAFYTTDGMRFEFTRFNLSEKVKLYEDNSVKLRGSRPEMDGRADGTFKNTTNCKTANERCSMCGSYGLNNNVDNTLNPPCLIIVDVNGDRKPFPKNASCYNDTCARENPKKFSDPDGIKLTDIFPIMITDKQAIPYGVAAQRAMYQAQKAK